MDNETYNKYPPKIMVVGDNPSLLVEQIFQKYEPLNRRASEIVDINPYQHLNKFLIQFNPYGGREEYDWYDRYNFIYQNYFILCFNTLYPFPFTHWKKDGYHK